MNGKNADLNTADNDIQPSQLAADHGNTGTATSESGKVSVLNRRTLGVASVLGLLFASLLAGTLFFTSADDSASPAPKVHAKTVSGNTVSAHAQIKPAEFSTANSFYHSVLDPANVSSNQKSGGALAASRDQGAAETSAAKASSTDSARSQCSGAACVFPRRAPVDADTGIKLRLFKLGVADSKTVNLCTRSRLCTAADGEIVGGARFALYEGRTVDETKLIDTYTVGEGGFELPGLQAGKNYTLKEVAAPAGYILNPNSYTLMVGADGRVGYQTGKIIRYPKGEFYIPNLKAPEPEVSLFKLGVKDLKDCTWGSCSADVAGSEILGGATFALYEGTALDEANKVGETFTVGQDGLKIPGLQAGKTYTLKEVAAPENYDINPATYTFEVDADGKAKYQTDSGSQSFTDNKIYFPNQKAAPPAVTVRLFKLGVADSKLVKNCTVGRTVCSAADGELVEGAKFALYKGSRVDEANKVGDYTVGEGGVELSGLQQGSYTLKEVEAPAGYELNPNTVTFTVRANGTVYRRYSKFIYDFKNNEFYFPNLKVQTIDISLNKVSDKDTPLENVKFDLYEADNPNKPVQNITTGNDGKANLTVTPGGKYRLVETQTTPGYALLPQPIEFQVEANGTVTIDKQNGNVNTVTGGDKTLKVVNYPEGKLPLSGQSGFLVVLLSGLSLLLVGVAISLVGRKRN
ncbi:MAG: SpaA isopeptide-forming pilin-related protein [Varibaculum cambriense]|uniref:SpaA isopeptide-forming pilin-related protein n=2 Tax=Varibaculum cambriense TaxID=184870 RepID=UPI002914D2B3|nr:SpaA isopeptide-forming pilin-related protein [Varibaculum cambriense]MDU4944959.1 SpaA isopeptide-forming pilin-related protein [Varibaculum cambriense]